MRVKFKFRGTLRREMLCALPILGILLFGAATYGADSAANRSMEGAESHQDLSKSFKVSDPGTSPQPGPVDTPRSESINPTNNIRELCRKEIAYFDKKWLVRYVNADWKALSRKISLAEAQFQGGDKQGTESAYIEIRAEFLAIAQKARNQEEWKRFEAARRAYQNEFKKYDTSKLPTHGGDAWKEMLKLKEEAEFASKNIFVGEAAFKYEEALTALQAANLHSEHSLLAELSRLTDEKSRSSDVPQEERKLKLQSVKAAEQAEVLKTDLETRQHKMDELRLARSKDHADELISGEATILSIKARELFRKQDFAATAAIYERLLEDNERNVALLSNLGVVRFDQARYDEAERLLRAAVVSDPYDAFSLSILGMILNQQGRYDDAIRVLRLAVAVAPNIYQCFNYLGISYHKKGNLEMAEKYLLKVLELNPDFSAAHFNLAAVLICEKPPATTRARLHYRKAIELGSEKDSELEAMLAAKP